VFNAGGSNLESYSLEPYMSDVESDAKKKYGDTIKSFQPNPKLDEKEVSQALFKVLVVNSSIQESIKIIGNILTGYINASGLTWK